MNNSASPAAGAGGFAQTSAAAAFLNGLAQATITGWFNLDGTASLARLVDRADNSVGSGQWSLYFDGDTSRLQLNLEGTPYVSGAAFGGLNNWIFFAAVINEVDSGNRIKFYAGDIVNAAALAGNLPSTSAGLGTNTKRLTLGNRESGTRALDGYLWDVRIYNEALTAGQVEELRASAIPEPAMVGLLIPAAGLFMRRRSR
jgi:hypothetical protein